MTTKKKKIKEKCCKNLINSRILCLVIPKVHNFFTPDNSRKIYFLIIFFKDLCKDI
jgi:hypothetical protein